MMTREQYLFQCLAEELGEVGKECLKASRFGALCDWYEGRTNLDRANVEWSQVAAIMSLIEVECGHKFVVDEVEMQKKLNTFEQFYDHSVNLGLVEPRDAGQPTQYWYAECGVCEDGKAYRYDVKDVGADNPHPAGLFCPACKERKLTAPGVLNFVLKTEGV